MEYEGRPINKLQNGTTLSIFKTQKSEIQWKWIYIDHAFFKIIYK